MVLPGRTNVILMGIDARDTNTNLGRTDTLILATIQTAPIKPYIGILSIPRDLWVVIPGHGENRINSAYFFAEIEQTGSGPQATMNTIDHNFNVKPDYFVQINFEEFRTFVELLGGVEISLPRPMSGYPEGTQYMDGDQALAFVRDRMGSDDFFRMERGQLFLKALWRKMLTPSTLLRLPEMIPTINATLDTDIPVWQWPPLIYSILRVGPEGIDARTITREMVQPFTTSGGAQVLSPNWDLIRPLINELFEE